MAFIGEPIGGAGCVPVFDGPFGGPYAGEGGAGGAGYDCGTTWLWNGFAIGCAARCCSGGVGWEGECEGERFGCEGGASGTRCTGKPVGPVCGREMRGSGFVSPPGSIPPGLTPPGGRETGTCGGGWGGGEDG
jgi:hypothetical protein